MIYNVNDLLDIPSNIKEVIKRYLTEYEIYSYYLGYAFQVGKNINSPLRKDPNPSFNIGYNSTLDCLMYFDHGDASYAGDCFKFVAQLHSLSYEEACHKVYIDYVTGKIKNPNSPAIVKYDGKKAVPGKVMQFEPRDFTKEDELYWDEIDVNKQLRELFKIKGANSIYVDLLQVWSHTPSNPIYVYKTFNKIRAYRPMSESKVNKWLSNCTKFDIQGWEQLPMNSGCDTLIITKSLKDCAVLRSMGYLAIAPSSENTMIPPEAMRLLVSKFGFKKFILLFDRDHGGLIGTRKMFIKYRGEYNICFKFIGRGFPKDVSAFRRLLGAHTLKRYLLNLLQHAPNEQFAILSTNGSQAA